MMDIKTYEDSVCTHAYLGRETRGRQVFVNDWYEGTTHEAEARVLTKQNSRLNYLSKFHHDAVFLR